MGVFDGLRALLQLAADGTETSSSGGDGEWRWGRVDEQPFDHYTDTLDEIKQLKRDRAHDEVETLLLWCVDFAEAEAKFQQQHEDYGYAAIPPAYYRHLAIVYRKDDRYQDEVEILDRYVDACRNIGNMPQTEMTDRLERARELVASNAS